MARKDVDIRIRAKDDASRNARKSAESLTKLAEDGNKAASSASRSSKAFTALAADMTKLQDKLGGLKEFGTVVAQMDKARASVDRLGTQLESSTRGFDAVNQRALDAARASAAVRTSIEGEAKALELRNRLLDANAEKQKANNEALKAAVRAQEALNGTRRKGIEVSGNTATKGVGIEAGAPVSSARASMSVFLAADVASAEAEKNRLNTAIKGLTGAIDASKAKIKSYKDDLRQATATEREFSNEAERAGNAVLKARTDLEKANQAFAELESKVADANRTLGTFAFTQEDVARESARAEEQLRQQARAIEVFDKFSRQQLRGGGTIGDSTTGERANAQAQAIQRARDEVALLRGEQEKLDATIRASSGNITTQIDTYDRLTRAVKLAEEQVRKLEIQQRLEQNRGVKTGFGQWIAEQDRMAQSSAKVAEASSRVAQAVGQIAPQAQRASAATRNMAQSTDQASGALVEFGRNTRTTLSFMQRLRGEVLAISASFVGFYAAFERGRAAVKSFQAVETAQARLGVAFRQDAERVNQEIEWLNQLADRLGFTFDTLAGSYGKIAIAAQSAGFTVADTRDLFESLSVAARVNNTSMAEMQGVLRAVEQMMSKGKIQAEELRGQLGDRMTGAFQTFATALGMTTEQLDEALKKGEVYANRSTMLKFAARLDQMYGSQLPKSMGTLTFAFGQFERDMEKANLLIARGFVPALMQALKSINEFANSTEGQATFTAIGEAAGTLISILAQVPQYFDLIVLAAKGFIAVKLAQWVGGIGTGLQAAAANFVAFSTAMTASTAATGRYAAMQRTLTLGIRQTSFALAVYEAQLRASAGSSAVARFGTLGLATAVSGLRTVMLGTAAVARTMWAAIGGPVGLAAAGIGLVLMNWGSNIDAATSALQEHERQLQLVVTGYQNAGKDAKDWADQVKGVTELDAQQNLLKLEQQFSRALGGITSETRTVEKLLRKALSAGDGVDPAYLADITSLGEAVSGLRDGSISIDDFRKRLSDLATSTGNDSIRQLAERLNSVVTEAADGEQSIAALGEALDKQRAIVRVFAGTASEADKALLGLTEAADTTAQTFEDTSIIDEYEKALQSLKEQIPSLAEEMKKLKEVTDLNTSAWGAFIAAVKTGDLSKIAEVGKLWLQGLGNLGQMQQDRFTSAYGGASSDVLNRIVYVEGGQSGGGPSTSSARGIGQFTEGTWLSYFNRLYPELRELNDTQKLALRTSEEHAMKLLDAFTRDNQATLLRAGVNAGPAETYLAHFLGAGDAVKVLLANPEELAANIVDPASVKANPSVFQQGMTIRDLIDWSANKMGDGSAITGTGQTEREKQMEEERKATQQRLSDLDHQIAQQKLINDGKEREAAIEDAIRAAKAENANISAEELNTIRERTGLLWDQQNAQREIELSEERVNQLYELRQQLMEQRQMALDSGDATKADALRIQIEGINTRLQEAISKTIAMWQAVGGPEADASIAKLQTMNMSIDAGKTRIGAFGLSMQTWQGVFDSAIGGIVGAFDSFAQAVANGQNAFKAFGSAVLQTLAQVLQQIAVAIIRMQILKMLSGMGGSIGQFATMALGGMTGHTGGVVGSMAIGSGNSIRSGWVANAYAGAYHSGGIAGLRADEVSATLKKGEEILTEEDPRHRFNAGGEASGNKGSRLTQVLAIGDDEIANAVRGRDDVTITHIKRNAPTIRRLLGM